MKNNQPFAKKSLGQHFLSDEKAILKIASAIPENTPLLLEIGPGRGAITSALSKRCQCFGLLEKDDNFVQIIPTLLKIEKHENFHVWHEDALNFDWERIWTDTNSPKEMPLMVASNLPYNVATEIFFRLLAHHKKIPLMVLMFQKEVGARLAAKAATKSYNHVSILAQNAYEVEIQQILKPGAFTPPPKVESAVLVFKHRPELLVPFETQEQESRFTRLLRASFTHKRKTVQNSIQMESHQLPWSNLAKKEFFLSALEHAKIDPKQRAETIAIQNFGELFRFLEKNG